MLAATEPALARLAACVRRARAPLRGASAISQALGAIRDKYKVGKHFIITITDNSFSFVRDIAAEAALDGLYVMHTNLSAEQTDSAGVVQAYNCLVHMERAFRLLKTVDLELRPVFHSTAPRARAHVLRRARKHCRKNAPYRC